MSHIIRGLLAPLVVTLGLSLMSCSAASSPEARPSKVAEPLDDIGTPQPAPTWTAAARADALATAEAACAAFMSKAGRETWIETITPLLTPSAAAAYATVDPAGIVGTQVLPGASIVDANSPYLAVVAVPTDAGEYELLLQRDSDPAPWKVERITEPGA